MKCAIYTRVSTDDQETSIINQQEYFKEYVKRHNYEIYDFYSDALSGTNATKRLSFQRLIKDGKAHKYDILLAKSYSRFGRNQQETLKVLSELFEYGIRIIFVEDGLDSQSDKGQFGLFAWLAEQESRKVSDRIKLTWEYYNKEGKVHTTTAPHGYDYDSKIKNFVVNEQEAEIVRMIYEMYLRGNGIRKIANYLNDGGYRTKNNCEWSIFLIKNILCNEFYIGSLVQGKRKTIDVTVKKMENIDKKDWIIHKNHHRAIISEEDFYNVQEQFAKRSKFVIDNRKSRHSNLHIFSNLVRCKICGSTCTFKRKKKENYIGRYSCINYEQKGVSGCGHRRNSIVEDVLIQAVKSELTTISKNNFDIIKEYYKKKKANVKPTLSDNNLKKVEKQIEEKTDMSLTLLEGFTKGLIGELQFKLQNEVIEKDLKNLMAKKEKILFNLNKKDIEIDEEGEVIETVKGLLNLNPEQWTNEMMKKIVEKIEVDMPKNYFNIFFKFSMPK